MMSEELNINIKFSNEKKLTVTLKSTDTVSVLKQKIAEQLSSTDTPLEPDQQTLIYAGRILKDNNETIENIKVKNGNTIHMVRAKKHQPKPAETTKAAETTTASTPASTPASTTTPAPAASQPSPAAANPFAQLGQGAANPFAQLGFNSGFASAMNNQAQNPASPFGGNLPPLDPNMLNSMLENPAVLNMLSSMFQNPQMMDMLFSSSPQLAAFNTPEFRSTMNQMMSNPETLRSILQLSNMYGNMFGGAGAGAAGAANPFGQFQTPASNTASTPGSTTTPQTGATPATPQMPDMSALLSMLGGMPGMGMPGAGAAAGAAAGANAAANQQPPEVRYSTQLAQLQDMGFYDSAQNIRALTITGGRVEAAVEWLLNNPF
jgi:ubiquilin